MSKLMKSGLIVLAVFGLASTAWSVSVDFTAGGTSWVKEGSEADSVLLQTIYGTAQDSAGNITANTARALSEDKGMATAFAVPQAVGLDKVIFKDFGVKVEDNIRFRIFNVTGRNYLSYSSHPTVTKAEPGGSGNPPILDYTVTTPGTIPYHSELGDGRKYTDMVVNCGPLSLTAGEYFITVDNLGSDFTVCSMVKGTGAACDLMGKHPDGTPLPKRATVTTSAATGNTYYYYLSATSSVNYSAASELFAFQMTLGAPANAPPQVNAGENQIIVNPINTATLDGTVTDDGLPNPPGAVTTLWTKQSGPGTVTFGDASAVDTTATFSAYGVYVLRLTADDSELNAYDEVQITYQETPPSNLAPVVNAGNDQAITLPAVATLDASVTDDGKPNPPGVVTQTWTKTSGPGTVIFADATAVDTIASFSQSGTYVLRLTASDSELQSFDELTVTVNAAAAQNEPPKVNAGPNLWVTMGRAVTLNATVTPTGSTKSWSKVSGPGTVTFGSPSAEDTTVTFSAAGTYVLRLTGTYSGLSVTDDITVVAQTGTLYYVATTGKDTNPGTLASPWKTIQYAINHANVVPGTTVFVRGGSYNEQVTINKSGSAAGGYIILRNYAAEVPIIDGTGTNQIGIPALITISNQHHILVCGFEMRNLSSTGRNDTPAGVYVWDASYNIAICGNNIHNIVNASLGGNAHGIAFYGRTSTAMTNVLVEDNIVSNCRLGTSESLVLNSNIDGFMVKDNTVHDNDNIGIDFIGFEGYGSPDQARNGSCIRNTVYNINFANNTNYEGIKMADGIYVDGGTNIIIERNTVYNCNLGIEVASEHGGHTTDYITVRSNTIYNSDVGGLFFGGYDDTVGAAANCTFTNNTLYNNNIDNQGWGGEIIMQWYCSNNVVKNNAIYAAPGRRLINNENTSGSNNVFDYNVYWGQNPVWMWRNVSYSTFNAYKTACGQETHSRYTDPQFANIATLDLHLWNGGSTCINAGDPSLTYTGLLDIDGQARKTGSYADIGSDETLVP